MIEGNYLLFGEGWAQWVMAGTGLLALLLSAWAVWLLKRTLEETRRAVKSSDDAVQMTRDLGEAQIRAYLYCKSAKYSRDKDSISAKLEVANAGQSPASVVSIGGTINIHEVGGFPAMPRVLGWVGSTKSTVTCQPIIANGSTTEEITFFWDLHFPMEDDGRTAKFKRHIFDYGNEIWLDLVVKWSDVFGNRHEVPVGLSAVVAPSPTEPKKRRSKSGILDLRMDDTRHRIIETEEEN